MRTTLNDVHSQLNATEVADVRRPMSLTDLCGDVKEMRASGREISVAGGRHAMGGQQFRRDSIHFDMTALDCVLGEDSECGLLHIEAGAMWPRIIEATHAMTGNWAIHQKQTGVDAVTLGGSISANAHGRGLAIQPLGNDIEDLTLINADGDPVRCSRTENHELFSLVIGGYGLFGVIYSATLRLVPRQRVRRLVDIIDLDDAMNAVHRRAAQGCTFGDFQFVIDSQDEGFLRRGVFACYQPVAESVSETEGTADLAPDAWLRLLKLAHEDKGSAFQLYAEHYLGTNGNCYWSDIMQLSTYLPSYVDFLERAGMGEKETLVIGEHYVPPERLLEFMDAARATFRKSGAEVIYGTIRAIDRDTTSFLPWAKRDYACVIFNIRTSHSVSGISRTADTFQDLTSASNRLGGSIFLTYHRHATAAQIESCYPGFRKWLELKLRYDPHELFSSDWYVHYRDAFRSS